MSLQLPGTLQWVADVVNAPFPQGDEDQCQHQATRWRRAATTLAGYKADMEAAARTTLAGFASGVTSDALASEFRRLTAGEPAIDDLITQLRQLADAADNVGVVIRGAKSAIIAELTAAAGKITAILASFTSGSQFDLLAAVAATRAAVLQIIDNAAAEVTRTAATRSITALAFEPTSGPMAPTPVRVNGQRGGPEPTAPVPVAPVAPVPVVLPEPRQPAAPADGPAVPADGPAEVLPATVAPATTTATTQATSDVTAAPTTSATSDAATTPTTATTSDTTATPATHTGTDGATPADHSPPVTTQAAATTSDKPATPTNPTTGTSSTPAASTDKTGTAATGSIGDRPTASTGGDHTASATTTAGDNGTSHGSDTTSRNGSVSGAAVAARGGEGSAAAAPTGTPAHVQNTATAPASNPTGTTSGATTATASSAATTGTSAPTSSATSGSATSTGTTSTPAGTTTNTATPTARGAEIASDNSATPAARQAAQTAAAQPAAGETSRTAPADSAANKGLPDAKTHDATQVQKAGAKPGGEVARALSGQQERRDADGGSSDSPPASPMMGFPGMAMMPPMFGAAAPPTPAPGDDEGRRPRRVLKLDGAEVKEPGAERYSETGKAKSKDDAKAAPEESHSSLHADDDAQADSERAGLAERFTDVAGLDFELSRQLADEVLERTDMTSEKLRHRLGDVDLATHRGKVNAAFWAALTDAEQCALVRAYPVEIANSVGTPIEARIAAADLLLTGEHLDRVRTGVPLTGAERQLLRQLASVRTAIGAARTGVRRLNPDWDVYLWATDPDRGRIVVMAGADPRRTEAHHIHLPGPGAAPVDLGAHLAEAIDHLDEHRLRELDHAVTATVWIGCSPADSAGAARLLCSDIAVFNAEHETAAGEPEFGEHHVYAPAPTPSGTLDPVEQIIALPGPGPAPTPDAPSDRSAAAAPAQIFGGRYFGLGLGVDPAVHLLQRKPRTSPNFGGQPASRRLCTANPCVRRTAQLR